MTSDMKLLPLPRKGVVDIHTPTWVRIYGWTQDQIEDYARACIEADRKARADGGEAVELTVCCGREECGGECGNEWRGTEWVRKHSPGQPSSGGVARLVAAAQNILSHNPAHYDTDEEAILRAALAPFTAAQQGVQS